MESCEVRLNLISTTVSDQEEKVRKLERLQIELEWRREVLERRKEEEVVRKKRLERTDAFLKQVKAGITFSRETKDETTLLVRDELRRQEDLEKRRLDFETMEMEKQAKNIFDQEAEVDRLERELKYVEVSCFSEATLTTLKREMAVLRSSLLQRRVLQRWLRTVQKRNREREKENEMEERRTRLLRQKDEMVDSLRERMRSKIGDSEQDSWAGCA